MAEFDKNTIIVADLDPLMPSYNVVNEHGRTIGEKSELFGYLKPQYTKDGRPLQGGRWTFESRRYKSDPPWFRFEVIKIDKLGGSVAIHAQKPRKEVEKD